jgi:hypothetical protein
LGRSRLLGDATVQSLGGKLLAFEARSAQNGKNPDQLRDGTLLMARENKKRGGFTLLDGVALVIGAAVASVHLRVLSEAQRGSAVLALFWITFAGVALTAAGPFMFLARRFVRGAPGYPGIGDRLWGILGLPWLVTAGLPSTPHGQSPSRADLYVVCLGLGLAVASVVALSVVWKTWVLVSPEAARTRGPSPWTNRVGLVLSVAWPLQCGFGLLVIGS